MKTSELMLKAKAILNDGTMCTYENRGQKGVQVDNYICHSIMKADGSYWPDVADEVKEYSEPCKKALAAVAVFTSGGGTGGSGHYCYLIDKMFGYETFNVMGYQAVQAGRHRLLDFIIAEFQAQGD